METDVHSEGTMPEARTEPMEYRTLAQAAADVIDHVHALGLEPDATSRLVTMRRTLERGYIPFEDPEFPIALEAMRDIQDLMFVFGELRAHLGDRNFVRVVKHLVNDSVLPQHDRENSPGRDAQFELYLAAVCQRAGMSPVSYEEPDIRCTVEGTTFAIAAKRVKTGSPQAIKRHVRKGAEQIRRAGYPGVIALDLSLPRNERNQPIVSSLQSQLYEMIAHTENRQFFEAHEHDIYRWVEDAGVRGVVVFASRIRLRPNRQWGVDATMCWLRTTVGDAQAEQEYAAFYSAFLKGFPDLVDRDATS